MKNRLLNNKDTWIVLVASLIGTILFSFGTCIPYGHLTFDSSELLTWDYLFTKNSFPYGNYYYPYGLIYYLKSIHVFFLFISSLIIPISFTVIFIYLKRLYNKALLASITFAAFVLFISLFTGFSTFGRYGIVLTTTLIYVLVLTKKKELSHKTNFYLGFMNGLLFSLIYDQGIYSIMLYCISIIIYPILHINPHTFNKKKYLITLLTRLSLFSVGVILVVLPFCIYLISTKSLLGFIANLSTLNDIAQYAKTPFFHSIKSIDNIFTIVVMIITIVYIAITLYSRKQKESLSLISSILLLITLFLLQQKNILRSIDTQITFYSFFLVILLLNEGYLLLRKHTQSLFLIAALQILIFIAIGTGIGLKSQSNSSLLLTSFSFHSFIHNVVDTKGESRECVNSSIKSVTDSNKEYSQIITILKGYKNFNGKVYSYPGDPIFYILLSQAPPYYSAIYQASPLYAQRKLITYIQEQKIKYIIYNFKNFSVQDEVPNFIRAATLQQYIMTNFSPKTRTDNFMILERNKTNFDFLKNKNVTAETNFLKSMLQIDLQSIPRSEGLHKEQSIKNNNVNVLYTGSSLKDFNNYLKKNSIDSHQKYLSLVYKNLKKSQKNIELTIKTQDGLVTKIRFQIYGTNVPYIINLAHIPLFYRTRILQSVAVTDSPDLRITLLHISNNSVLW